MDLNNFKTELEGYLSKLSGNTRIPVGQPWWGFDPKSKPAGVQLFAGQELSRSAYQKHWELISSGKRTLVTESEWQSYVSQNGFCPYYSSGDNSTTYRMPLVKNVYPEFVSALIDAGQYIEAGLPNIMGDFNPISSLDTSGAFTCTTNNVNIGTTSGSLWGRNTLKFDASLSNSIYGNSDTVQPPSLTFLIGEYVISSVATIGEADKNSILEMVNKLEMNISNMIKSVNGVGADINGNIDVISLMMPDYSAGITVSLPFTAPTHGYFSFFPADDINTACILVNGVRVIENIDYAESINSQTMLLPVSANDVITSNGGTPFYPKFYPLKGV